MAICWAGVREDARGFPCSTIVAKTRAASGLLMERAENSTVATRALPKAAPIDRENCTEAAASPRRNRPAALWTLTCTTPITVPINSPLHSSRTANTAVPRADAHKARTTRLTVAIARPEHGHHRGQAGLVD